MDTMKISGYMNEIEWDGRTLRARGTNKTSHFALVGGTELTDRDKALLSDAEQRKKAYTPRVDELVVDAAHLEVMKFKGANALANGHLQVRDTRDGREYTLHFRRKQAADFQSLRDALTG